MARDDLADRLELCREEINREVAGKVSLAEWSCEAPIGPHGLCYAAAGKRS
jgi:hypothetical protein